MAKKTTKSVIVLLFAMILMLQGGMFCFAGSSDDQEPDQRGRYINISNITSSCVISGVTASCNASMFCKSSVSMTIKMELQKLQSGSYSTVKTWTESKTGTSLSVTKTKLINVLSTYRLKATFTAGSETVTAYAYP